MSKANSNCRDVQKAVRLKRKIGLVTKFVAVMALEQVWRRDKGGLGKITERKGGNGPPCVQHNGQGERGLDKAASNFTLQRDADRDLPIHHWPESFVDRWEGCVTTLSSVT